MRYRIGTKNHVLDLMADAAIRDRESFLEATQHCKDDPETMAARQHAKDCIADFKQIQKSLKGSA